MKRKVLYFLVIFLSSINSWAQTPQNVTQLDNENKDSLWESTSAIIFVVVLIVLLIVGRTWSKKVHKKRDELSSKDED